MAGQENLCRRRTGRKLWLSAAVGGKCRHRTGVLDGGGYAGGGADGPARDIRAGGCLCGGAGTAAPPRKPAERRVPDELRCDTGVGGGVSGGAADVSTGTRRSLRWRAALGWSTCGVLAGGGRGDSAVWCGPFQYGLALRADCESRSRTCHGRGGGAGRGSGDLPCAIWGQCGWILDHVTGDQLDFDRCRHRRRLARCLRSGGRARAMDVAGTGHGRIAGAAVAGAVALGRTCAHRRGAVLLAVFAAPGGSDLCRWWVGWGHDIRGARPVSTARQEFCRGDLAGKRR